MKKKKESKQVNKNISSVVRIDPELKNRLKVKAAIEKTSMKALIEGCLAELLEVK